MQNRIVFREMLSELKVLADQKENVLTIQEIKAFFEQSPLEEEQLELIYQYLSNQKIKVLGYTAENEVPGEREEVAAEAADGECAGEENPYDTMYPQEMETVEFVTDEELERLFEAAVNGSDLAKSRLVELHLKLVCEIADTCLSGDLPQSDLIQEGNVGLLLAIDHLTSQPDLKSYREFLRQTIRAAMEEVIVEQQEMKEMDEGIVQRVNYLNEAVRNLERDLEHKVSLNELSAYLEMSTEEIKKTLRMAGDEIEVEDSH